MLHNLVFVAIPLDAAALRALQRLPSATKPPPTLTQPVPQKHLEKAGEVFLFFVRLEETLSLIYTAENWHLSLPTRVIAHA